MIKSLLLAFLPTLVFLQTSRAQDAYRISIVRGDQYDEHSFRGSDFDPPLDESIAASLNTVPIIYFPLNPGKKSESSNAFYIVIENTQSKESKITLWALSSWYRALAFTFVDGTTKKSYSIAPTLRSVSADAPQTLSFPAHGMRILQVDFTGGFVDLVTSWGQWCGFPPPSKHPIFGQLTVTFKYDSDGKGEASSKPTTVILMAK